MVEKEPFRTGEADLVIPIPAGTAEISQSELLDHTETVLKSESLIAPDTSSYIVESLTKVILGSTLSSRVKSPFFRAPKTDLVLPIPLGTSQVSKFLDEPFASSLS